MAEDRTLPSKAPGTFDNARVRVGEWWEEAAWTADTGGVRPPASQGTRAFGRRDGCTSSESIARSNGHTTASITSWGHTNRWENEPAPLEPKKLMRKQHVEGPSTVAVEATLHGEGGLRPDQEALIFGNGTVATPHHSGRAAGAMRPAHHSATSMPPFATGDAPPHGTSDILYSAVTGVAKVGTHAGLGAAPADLPAKQQPSSLMALVGDVGEPTPRARPPPYDPAASTPVQRAAAPPPTPAASAAALAACAQLADVLADRHTDWFEAFRPYDAAGAGEVSPADLLRIFRNVGISPPPSMLRELPAACLTPRGGVHYPTLGSMLPQSADLAAKAALPPLLSSAGNASVRTYPHSSRHAGAQALPQTTTSYRP